MTTEAQVRQAKNPQEAMLAIAQALDRIEAEVVKQKVTTEDWYRQEWATDEQQLAVAVEHDAIVATLTGYQPLTDDVSPAARIIETEGETTVAIPLPSQERVKARNLFQSQSLRLADFLGDETDWASSYALGGPTWLYHGNRELVMSYPYSVRQQLVQDLEQDDPKAAAEMARDILKQPCEDGPGGTAMHIGTGEIG